MCSKSRRCFWLWRNKLFISISAWEQNYFTFGKIFYFFLNSYKVSSPSITRTTTWERLQQSRITKYILPAIWFNLQISSRKQVPGQLIFSFVAHAHFPTLAPSGSFSLRLLLSIQEKPFSACPLRWSQLKVRNPSLTHSPSPSNSNLLPLLQ